MKRFGTLFFTLALIGVCTIDSVAQSVVLIPSETTNSPLAATPIAHPAKFPSPLGIVNELAYFDPDSLGQFGTFRIPDTVQHNGFDYRRYAFSERFTPTIKGKWYIDSVLLAFRAVDFPDDGTSHLTVFTLKPYISTTNGNSYPIDFPQYIIDSTIMTKDSLVQDDSVHFYMVYFTKHHKRLLTSTFYVMLSTQQWGEHALGVEGDLVTTGDQTGRTFDTSIDRSYWDDVRAPEGDSVYFGPMANSYVNSDQNVMQPNLVMIAFLSDPLQSGVTAVLTPDGNILEQNRPNAANGVTSIGYNLIADSPMTLKIFNILGDEVKTIFDGRQSAGHHTATVNVSDMPNGHYSYVLNVGGRVISKSLIVQK